MFRAALHIQLCRMGLPVVRSSATSHGALPRASATVDGDPWPVAMQAERRLHVALPTPDVARHAGEDWSFAYQRLAATNLIEIRSG